MAKKQGLLEPGDIFCDAQGLEYTVKSIIVVVSKYQHLDAMVLFEHGGQERLVRVHSLNEWLDAGEWKIIRKK